MLTLIGVGLQSLTQMWPTAVQLTHVVHTVVEEGLLGENRSELEMLMLLTVKTHEPRGDNYRLLVSRVGLGDDQKEMEE